MHILITGSTGLIGSELASFLSHHQHRVIRLVRREPAGPHEVQWDPASGIKDKASIEGIDAVVHLAGENIASGRWTSRQKRRIRESRIQGTRQLAQSLAHLFDPPKVLISVSSVGYYGDRASERIDETSAPGSGFLADLCMEWEAAALAASMRDIRVVHPRLGVVLSAAGGSLARMLPLFRRRLGGRIGSGAQYISWIAIYDAVRIIEFAIKNESIHGPINAVSPDPVSNAVFTRTLGKVLARPAILALPAFAARLLWGRMADEVLLAGARVFPAKLEQSNFQFLHPNLETALRHVLNPSSSLPFEKRSPIAPN